MSLKKAILEKGLEALFSQATIGIEKEGQRIDLQGNISQTRHPKAFGSRTFHPYIQTDFAESQLELITPVCESSAEALRFLGAVHEVTLQQLPESELLWPFSVPALLPSEDTILEAQMADEDRHYREYLTEKYGKYKQMVSGIHYNFGLTTEFLKKLAEEGESLVDLRNRVYMKLARQFLRYQWLLVYLLGASPFAPDAYFRNGEVLSKPVRSLRASRFGYANAPEISVSFDSLDAYISDLRQLVDTGQLIAEKEFYESVRFRGAKTVRDFPTKGIQYLEFRLFDLNPFAPYGITAEDARFIHLFLMGLLWMEETPDYRVGFSLKEETALAHPLDSALDLAEAEQIFKILSEMAELLDLPDSDRELLATKCSQLRQPEKTVGGQLWQTCQDQESLLAVGLNLAKTYKSKVMKRPFGLQAYAQMELSTQAFLADAIQYGFQLEILDERDQFVKLTFGKHIEYVKNGNMTSQDSYISPLIMENKVVTKKILTQAGFAVPASIQVTSRFEAERSFGLVANRPIVIKPKSTNYGLGISIFEQGVNDKADYLEAIELALKEDSEVMIEDFLAGTEYRFFVLDGETKAVLLRVPANVTGDGVSTVSQLVAAKNDNLLRGDGKSTPLKQIELGALERLQLKAQSYTVDSVIPSGKMVYLRANSNISTGGDSIDMTDAVHPSYKDIAVAIASAIGAKVCGVDLIIPDISLPVDSNSQSYGIIEANFNPMMMMHIFPAVGQSHRLTTDVLKMLYPEYPWDKN
ncbi:bifunctional glutamate--cysteine ligase GshA/glutathione synthetase GshB [Streptococcus merionis]|uniref:Glutathione biosynthesis bifunctional protein GshAB n=1 Tax=Streptococcus merionis TaxID=400065 RepID=A0A239SLG9_9STRE|nr:bifunctional glutamate--cysteine ligase GshA/glutathione synthetase GshB [Streptococcus merionis]SNU86119.1 bifunctional glutamate--cysteine ligase/glutathione synthase [Streptococcus merionis]